jgi:hypothetical protein
VILFLSRHEIEIRFVFPFDTSFYFFKAPFL